MEHGPFVVRKNLSIGLNPYSWNREAERGSLFINTPVTTDGERQGMESGRSTGEISTRRSRWIGTTPRLPPSAYTEFSKRNVLRPTSCTSNSRYTTSSHVRVYAHVCTHVCTHVFTHIYTQAGVGFSYPAGPANDTISAHDTHDALAQFLERHPSVKGREFFVSGESYGGHYVMPLPLAYLRRPLRDAATPGIPTEATT